MALIRYPEGQQRSGSSGGTVFSRNRFGAYIRPRTKPVNPNTERQSEVRAVLRNLAIAWNNDLDADQREGWEVYAANVPWLNRLGDEVRLTGMNMYLRSNLVVSEAALTRVDDAPTVYELGASPVLGATVADTSAQTLSIGYDNGEAWANEVGGALIVYMGRPQNPARTFYGNPWRFAGKVAGAATPPTSPLVVAVAPFPFGNGNRIWLEARALRADGRASERVRVDFLSVP